jgi:hypothetical protein
METMKYKIPNIEGPCHDSFQTITHGKGNESKSAQFSEMGDERSSKTMGGTRQQYREESSADKELWKKGEDLYGIFSSVTVNTCFSEKFLKLRKNIM